MPFRSMKMNFFICGFHRRVWCPKCTPASSRSFIVISATDCLLRGSAAALACRVAPPPDPLKRSGTPALAGRVRWIPLLLLRLPLAELEALARARLPVLLALLHARVAREEALAAEQRLQGLVLAHERARHTHADPAGLAGEPAAGDARVHVDLVGEVRHRERLERVQHQRIAAQVLERGPAVHQVLTRARD